MRKLLLIATALTLGLGMTVQSAAAAEEVVLQLKWVTQAQFAGYYVAQEKGYYADEGLDVTINPGGPDISPPQIIAGGGADVIIDWMPSALASREKGVALVNIAQPFKSSGMELTCRKDSAFERRGESGAGQCVARCRPVECQRIARMGEIPQLYVLSIGNQQPIAAVGA